MTLNKLLEQRDEWLSFSVDYGKFTEVVRKSLEFIPSDTATILENLGPLYSHVSCYRLFTDVEKLRRAEKNAEKAKQARISDQAERETSTNDDFRRRSARNGSITSTLSKRPKRDVFPSLCLICKGPGIIWITGINFKKLIMYREYFNMKTFFLILNNFFLSSPSEITI